MIGCPTEAKGLPRSSDRPPLGFGFAGEREAGFGSAGAGDDLRGVLADGGAVFEAVTGAAADEPDAVALGMAIDQEIAVGAVRVLADAGFGERSVAERGEALA